MPNIKVDSVARLTEDDLFKYQAMREIEEQVKPMSRLDGKRKKLLKELIASFGAAKIAKFPDGTVLMKNEHSRFVEPSPEGRTDTWYSLTELPQG